MTCNMILFVQICHFFEDLDSITTSASSKRVSLNADNNSAYYLTKDARRRLQEIMSKWFKSIPTDSLLKLFRLLVPEEDIGRVYYLKEKRLAHLLMSVLGLENSTRSNELHKWNETGDLSASVFKHVAGTEHMLEPTISVSQVDSHLEKLSQIGKQFQGKNYALMKTILQDIYLSMTALEIKWITRIILKNLKLCIEPKFFFDSYHKWMWKIYLIKNDLERTCDSITEFIKNGYQNDSVDSATFASIRNKYFRPELGTSIAIMECGRATGVDQVANEMRGKVCYVETKLDGERLQAHYDSSRPENQFIIYSKSGRNSTENRKLCQRQLLESFAGIGKKNFIVEGELLVFNEMTQKIEPFGTVQELGRTIRDKQVYMERRHFLVILYDLLYLNDDCLLNRPLNERKRLLTLNFTEILNYVHISPVSLLDFRPDSWLHSLQSLRQIYAECIEKNHEGLVIKNADSLYIPGCRRNWWKLKKDYIEGYGDVADFPIVAAIKSVNSGGLYDTFVVGLLTNKTELKNGPFRIPNFQAVFTVSLGLTRPELELLQAIVEARRELNSENLHYECQMAKGFKFDEYFGCCWLREPIVMELLGSGFIRERGMWCYSLRFPRIQKIRLDRNYMECITYEKVQELGKLSISSERIEPSSRASVPDPRCAFETIPEFNKETKKRVRFVFDEEVRPERLKKSDYHFHVSRTIGCRDREQLCNWLEERGFEVIWSYDALIKYSNRKILMITCKSDNLDEFKNNNLIDKFIETEDLGKVLKWDSSHFWISTINTDRGMI